MRRRIVVLLVAGWLLGLLTALVWPALATERQTVVVADPVGCSTRDSPDGAASLARGGWVVTRIDTMGASPRCQLERPRYVSVYEDLKTRPRGRGVVDDGEPVRLSRFGARRCVHRRSPA